MRDFQLPGRSPVFSSHGMVATSHTLASEVGVAILREGGNAMDAAIAACAMQCVVEPGSTGIGGDNFCLYAPGARVSDIIGYNGSGRAPAAASYEKLQSLGVTELTRTSPHSVTVPGAIDAWCRLHEDHGRMPLAEILAPAASAARNGYPIASRVHFDWTASQAHLQSNENLKRIFLPNDKVPAVGALHLQPGLADALEWIGQEGRKPFYEGDLALEILTTLQQAGGLHVVEDFTSARGEYVTPITSTFRGRTIHQCPPNGQGMTALMMLNLFEHGMTDDWLSEERLHFELEACRRAYGARSIYLADPAQADIPVDELIAKSYAKRLAANISDRANPPAETDLLLKPHRDTVTIQTVDKDRNVCAFINTLFWGWGSGITTPKHGIVLTNRGEGFNLVEGHPNCIAPGKRPLHTILPGLVSDGGRVTMTYGVMGGEYQAMGHAQFLSRMFDFDMDIQQAQDAPRWMVDPFNGDVEIERGVSADMVARLEQRGHMIVEAARPIGGSQAIAIDLETGVLSGGSDPRKDGAALGY